MRYIMKEKNNKKTSERGKGRHEKDRMKQRRQKASQEYQGRGKKVDMRYKIKGKVKEKVTGKRKEKEDSSKTG